MRAVHERCCGLDVHKRTLVACGLASTKQEARTFGTMTHEVLDLNAWLVTEGVTHVAMESTGVYWIPLQNLLEDGPFEMLVVNARRVKAVPGRKIDVKDAEWLANCFGTVCSDRGSYPLAHSASFASSSATVGP
jgi:transposase